MKSLSFLLLLGGAALESHVAASDDFDKPAVTCGSAIKIAPIKASADKYLLFESEGKNRQGGSGQHLATWLPDDPTNNQCLWMVRPAHHGQENIEYPTGDSASKFPTCTRPGDAVKCGDTIRLTNLQTKHNLHSHNVPSPMSQQQEVSVFEGEDSGDDWQVECAQSSGVWRRGEIVRLKNVATQKYLGGTTEAEFNERTCGRNCPLMNQLEVFARQAKDPLSEVKAQSGIYLHI